MLDVALVDGVGAGDGFARAAVHELHASDVGGVVAACGVDVVAAGGVVGVHALAELLVLGVEAVVHEAPEGCEPAAEAVGHCCGVGWGCEGMGRVWMGM